MDGSILVVKYKCFDMNIIKHVWNIWDLEIIENVYKIFKNKELFLMRPGQICQKRKEQIRKI